MPGCARTPLERGDDPRARRLQGRQRACSVGDCARCGPAVVSAVLDWETAHLGDPREDLGWVTNPLRAREHSIPGVWEPGDLLERWSERTGLAAEPEAVHWWSVLANLKLSVDRAVAVHTPFVDGRLDRVHQSPVAHLPLDARHDRSLTCVPT